MADDASDHEHRSAHEHDHGHGHDHGQVDADPEAEHHDHGDHDHEHRRGLLGRVREAFVPHSHDAVDTVDTELEVSQRGIRALLVSFVGLAVTALLQGVVVALSGSVALLGDTLHNVADALTAIPLAIAFTLGRRVATRRYTYGYGRAEDIAGLAVVLLITASAALAAYEALRRLFSPQRVDHLWLVAVAALIGFAGNELVARYRIRVGRDIGSAALVADGLHARTDGLTSLSVLVGAAGVALGFDRADPIVGLAITVAILGVLRQAAREVFSRLMDAVDPALVDHAEAVVRATPGVLDSGTMRLRWIGHALHAECDIVVAEDLSLVDAHHIADDTEHRLLHEVRRLTSATVHADPQPAPGETHHEVSQHHRARLF